MGNTRKNRDQIRGAFKRLVADAAIGSQRGWPKEQREKEKPRPPLRRTDAASCSSVTFQRSGDPISSGCCWFGDRILAILCASDRASVHHLDDPTYIQENPMVNRGVTAGLAWAFTTFYATNWHPLTWISHMIDCQLFGMNAGRHLLVNALIHVANTLLVFWFLLRTTHARWPSALVAALFALHPFHVESVAWASERKDTLCTFFGLLSLVAYVRYAEAPSICRYAWVAITLALGLLAKPMLVTWPFVMLLLDYWPLGRFGKVRRRQPRFEEGRSKSLVREKLPLFVLVAASAIITFVRNLMEALCARLPRPCCVPAFKRACVVCEIPAAHFLAE